MRPRPLQPCRPPLRAHTQTTRPKVGHQPVTLSVLGSPPSGIAKRVTPKSNTTLAALGRHLTFPSSNGQDTEPSTRSCGFESRRELHVATRHQVSVDQPRRAYTQNHPEKMGEPNPSSVRSFERWTGWFSTLAERQHVTLGRPRKSSPRGGEATPRERLRVVGPQARETPVRPRPLHPHTSPSSRRPRTPDSQFGNTGSNPVGDAATAQSGRAYTHALGKLW